METNQNNSQMITLGGTNHVQKRTSYNKWRTVGNVKASKAVLPNYNYFI